MQLMIHESGGSSRWLLLLHQVPTAPSSARVRIWRRLRSLGAVPIRGAAYALPNGPEQHEDLEWVKAEVAALGGHSSVFAADTVDGLAGDDIVAAFRSARADDYRQLGRKAAALLTSLAGRPRRPPRARLGRLARQLTTEWRALEAITFFETQGQPEVRQMLTDIDRHMSGARPGASDAPAGERLTVAAFTDKVWVTRPRPGIDRMASAWLIRRYVDPTAHFEFTVHSAREAQIPFDTFGVEFGHHGDRCTFETLAARFGLTDPVVAWIGRIVHDLDLKDGRFGLAEAPGIGRLVEGLRQTHADDHELLAHGIALIESLAASFCDEPLPAAPRPERSSTRRSARAATPPTTRRRTKPRRAT